ncbi:MAG: glycosyltransferase [Candidatus Levyibacteriota bacterium]
MSQLYLSVVVPSFNEMANLRKGVLDRIEKFMESQKFEYEVVIVDDGSTDGSVEFVEDFIKGNKSFKLIKNPHMGKAGAVTTGMLAGGGKYVLFTDMDQATPIEEFNKLIPFAEKGSDIVIGSRSSARKGAPWTRLLMAKGMILVRTIVVGLNGISDTQCGFKLFTQESAKELFSKILRLHHGFKKIHGSSVSAGFDVEVLYLAQKLGYKIKEVPVEWLYVETRRVSPIKDSLDALMDLARIKKNSLSGKYK